MQFTAVLLSLVSAASVAFADHKYIGFTVPNTLEIIQGNVVALFDKTEVIRAKNTYISTFYKITVPPEASGHTCGIVFRAEHGDTVEGTGRVVIYDANADGSSRGDEVANLVFNPKTFFYDYDYHFYNPTIDTFPCSSGDEFYLLSEPYGEYDVNVVVQDAEVNGNNVPHGFSLAYW